MKKVLVAGATGYLGQFVVKAFKAKGYWVRALGRSAAKLAPVEAYADELFIGEVTDVDSLTGVCDGIDIVFSSVGITRQKDGLTYKDVDYQANRNLLTMAEASGASKFMYVHVLNAEKLHHVAMIQAKQAFVDELKRSRLDHAVICPTGFFSDMEELLTMARSGRVYLFGDGESRINPIHGADLAEVCADALERPEGQIDVGGPEVFTYRDIAELAFDVLAQPEKITCIPKYLVSATAGALRWLTPAKVYGPVQFMAGVMTMDVIGQAHGQRRLADHFRGCAVTTGSDSSEDHPLAA
ncbi:MAG: SDR family oxidoreductase [Gammaproteobacteria bacterium]|nr:SDR family oxidoreductase [Gammaproteobacteria bacterium]